MRGHGSPASTPEGRAWTGPRPAPRQPHNLLPCSHGEPTVSSTDWPGPGWTSATGQGWGGQESSLCAHTAWAPAPAQIQPRRAAFTSAQRHSHTRAALGSEGGLPGTEPHGSHQPPRASHTGPTRPGWTAARE